MLLKITLDSDVFMSFGNEFQRERERGGRGGGGGTRGREGKKGRGKKKDNTLLSLQNRLPATLFYMKQMVF